VRSRTPASTSPPTYTLHEGVRWHAGSQGARRSLGDNGTEVQVGGALVKAHAPTRGGIAERVWSVSEAGEDARNRGGSQTSAVEPTRRQPPGDPKSEGSGSKVATRARGVG
jgi:hypothetical protein